MIQNALVDVFLMTETFQELQRRLNKRGTDDAETIQRRLANAKGEMEHWREYRYVILSGSAEEDERQFMVVAEAERKRTSRLTLNEF